MDFYSDTGNTLLASINKLKELPDFVKQAAIVDKDSIPDKFFALPEKRAFPISDPATTYISFGYWLFNQNKMSDMEKNAAKVGLVKAAEFFGISKYILDLAKSYQKNKNHVQCEKIANDYGLPEKKAYPLHTEDHVNMAIDSFPIHHRNYDIAERQQIAKKIMEKASNFNIPVRTQVIVKYATASPMSRTDLAAVNIAGRAMFTDNLQAQHLYHKLGRALIGNLNGQEGLYKVARVLESLDDHFGLNGGQNGFPDAFSTMFNMNEKMAVEAVETVPINIAGDAFTLRDLIALPADFYEEALGEDFAQAIIDDSGKVSPGKLASILPTLPMPEKNILVRYLRQHFASAPKMVD